MKAAVNQGTSRAQAPKSTGRASRSKDDRPGKLESTKFELMGKSEQPQPSVQLGLLPGSPGRIEEQDQPERQTPAPMLANYPNPGPPPGMQSRSLQSPISQNQSSQSPPSSRGDMPLPALPAIAPEDPAPWQAGAPDSPMFLPQLSASTLENSKRQMREPRPGSPAAPAAVRAPKLPTHQSYYTEKFVEQGEYRYRRRVCEPPNMPDVCFMPQGDRMPIVVAKP
jgi:hypothetical protein